MTVRFAIELRNYSFLALTAFLAACRPEPPVLPVTGEIRLEYVSESPPAMKFRLINQSPGVLYLRGSYNKSVGTNPWDAWMECLEPALNQWTPGPYALVDGEAGRVEVGIGKKLDLVLGFDHHHTFAQEYTGGRCKFKLKLEDGTIVASNEFQP